MIRPTRTPTTWMTLAIAAVLGLSGCTEQPGNEVETTPDEVISPEVPGEDAAVESAEPAIGEERDIVVEPPADEDEPAAVEPAPADADEPEAKADTAAAGDLVTPITFEGLMGHVAESDAKLVLVDCWASWCAPCKENFPHVIEMAAAYGDDGLGVIALSFDGGNEDEEFDNLQIAAANEFLADKDLSKAESYRLDQITQYEMFEKFDIRTIPAVFLYDSEGKEVARFTYEGPDAQFTYDEVEAKVAELLGVEPKSVVEAEPAE